mgnify:CR=1 FL=1
MSPNNAKFWDKISIRCGNEPVFLDSEVDPYDRIKLHAIRAGGFSIVAKSLKAAKSAQNGPKFYLDTVEETLTTRTENHTLSVSTLDENTIRVLVYSASNEVIGAGNGTVLSLTFSSKNEPGTYNLLMSDIILSGSQPSLLGRRPACSNLPREGSKI